MSGNSTLDPDNLPGSPDREINKGHGTGALGPSDSSDSGSDMQGPGDTELDSDTDRQGTGERASVGRDTPSPDGADIDTDHIETMPGSEKPEREDTERGS